MNRTALFLLLIFISFFPTMAFAPKGYVITEDSVYTGEIRFEVGYTDRGTRIKIYKDIRKQPEVFYSLEVKEYAYKKDTFVILNNVELVDESINLIPTSEVKVLARGRIKLYEGSYTERGPMRPTPVGVMPTQYVVTFYLLEDKNGYISQVRKSNFKPSMHRIISDAPSLLDRIEKGSLKFKDLEEIVKQYNYFKR